MTPTELSRVVADYYNRHLVWSDRQLLSSLGGVPLPPLSDKDLLKIEQERLMYWITGKYEWFVDRAFRRAFPEQARELDEWHDHECDY